jgi:hypothetical protein
LTVLLHGASCIRAALDEGLVEHLDGKRHEVESTLDKLVKTRFEDETVCGIEETLG